MRISVISAAVCCALFPLISVSAAGLSVEQRPVGHQGLLSIHSALLIDRSMLWMAASTASTISIEQIRADLDAGRGASPAPAPTAGESPAM
ncbi:hypothetical protein CQA48_23220 [Klebsiella pneumoniae]|nr:hypothetical protein CQA48_23220 [Klebsiella pneumoniae]